MRARAYIPRPTSIDADLGHAAIAWGPHRASKAWRSSPGLAPAGFNCAEAVNFGPPDWLPWGTYVANKYRREGRSATLSHDALLIALVTAAPDVRKRLERAAKVRLDPVAFEAS